jgi:FkbM family methyltransferase
MGKLSELKYEFIRTPLEQPLMKLRHVFTIIECWSHPELKAIYDEGNQIERLWKRIVREDSNCIDAGCHYGSMLSRFCSLAPLGHHVAVEAVPQKVAFLRRKFREVEVLNLALSDQPGTATFYIDANTSGFSSLARHSEGKFHEIRIQCSRLDDVIPRDRRFDVIKVDVEGAELPLMQGAKEFLRRDRPTILFECGPSGPAAFGYSAGDLHEFFLANQYSVYFLNDVLNGGAPIDRASFEAALVFPFKAFNWVAVPAERAPDPFNSRRGFVESPRPSSP